MDPSNTTTARQLAEDLGISREALKKLRDALTEGADWLPAPPGQPILFTAAGVKKIRAHLQIARAPVNPWTTASAGVRTAAPATPIRETLAVIRPAKGSTRIILCLTEDGRTVSLTAKNNANFIAGMQVPNCVQAPQSPAYYHYEGRLPRRKGRF